MRWNIGVARLVRLAAVALSLLGLSVPSSAHANGLLLFGPQGAQSVLLLLSSGSLCVQFTYDLNGNRTAQSVGTVSSAPVLWGAGNYGCFLWHP